MGEARRRGTYEQRRAEGIERQRLEAIEREKRRREHEESRRRHRALENEALARAGKAPKRTAGMSRALAFTMGLSAVAAMDFNGPRSVAATSKGKVE